MVTWSWWSELRTQLAVAPLLIRRLGWWRTIAISRSVERGKRSGEPFSVLPSPEGERERQSRAQIGPAILLYRRLREVLGAEEALSLTESVVTVAAVRFLQETIGHLDRRTLAELSREEREAYVGRRGERFFNATIRWETIDETGVAFTVRHCRFPELCAVAEVPELAPVFCQGDAQFFRGWGVKLERPHTLATGGGSCPFLLRWMDEGAP